MNQLNLFKQVGQPQRAPQQSQRSQRPQQSQQPQHGTPQLSSPWQQVQPNFIDDIRQAVRNKSYGLNK